MRNAENKIGTNHYLEMERKTFMKKHIVRILVLSALVLGAVSVTCPNARAQANLRDDEFVNRAKQQLRDEIARTPTPPPDKRTPDQKIIDAVENFNNRLLRNIPSYTPGYGGER
jgi:hypothetical protein